MRVLILTSVLSIIAICSCGLGDELPPRSVKPLPDGALFRLGGSPPFEGGGLSRVAFSPDGKLVGAATADGQVRVFDVAKRRQLCVIGEPKEEDFSAIPMIAFSTDGRYVAWLNWQGIAHVHDARSGKKLHVIEMDRGANLIGFPSDKELVVIRYRIATVWRLPAKKVVRKIQLSHQAQSIAFSPNGQLLALAAGGEPNHVQIWNLATGKRLHKVGNYSGVTTLVAFSRDGKSLVATSLDTTNVWDVASGKLRAELSRKTESFCNVAVGFSADGRQVMLVLHNGTLHSWDLRKGKRLPDRKMPGGFSGAFSQDGQWLASAGPTVTLTHKPDELRPPRGHRGELATVAISPDDKLIATGAEDRTICLWDGKNGKLLRRHEIPGDMAWGVVRVLFTPDGKRLIAGVGNGEIVVWDSATGKQLAKWKSLDRRLLAMALSPDGKVLATGGDRKEVILSDPITGKVTRKMTGHLCPINCIAFSPNGRSIAACDTEHTVRLWRRNSGKQRWRTVFPTGGLEKIVFAPDGKSLALAARHSIHVMRAKDGRVVKRLVPNLYSEWLRSLQFSPDGKFLAAGGGEGAVFLWDVRAGKLARCLFGHQVSVSGLAFSTDGKRLVSASGDGSALVRDIVTSMKRIGRGPN